MTLHPSTPRPSTAPIASRGPSLRERRPGILRRALLALALLALPAAPALAADPGVKTFDPRHFGKVELPVLESLGGAASAAAGRGNVYEPISRLLEDDPIFRQARAIVRLDILSVLDDGREVMGTCTASLVAERVLMTNNHCIPGTNGAVRRAVAVFDYLKPGSEGTTQVEVLPTPLATDTALDYSFVELRDPAPEGIEPVRVDLRAAVPGERLMIIHHPHGRPKVMTAFGCAAHGTTQPDTPELRHVCDTEPGTSGSPILDANGEVVAIHHRGGLNTNDPNSFNRGTVLRDIAALHAGTFQGPGGTGDAPATGASASPAATAAASPTDPLNSVIETNPGVPGTAGGATVQDSIISGN